MRSLFIRNLRKREAGQTLVIALIVMGLLLILGFVFLGIVDRNIRGGATAQTRTASDDYAQAGIRYAMSELVSSPLGADWRGTPVTLPASSAGANFTGDPDAYYLRPANFVNGQQTQLTPGSPQLDLGGPDGLGPFIRENFPNGRALIRVRWTASDANFFSTSPTGPLAQPGAVKHYLVIEAVGRVGAINQQDPTTMIAGGGVQFQGFSSPLALQAGLGALKTFDGQIPHSRRIIAFATTGVTDFARYITNKFNETRPADVGIPTGLGVNYLGSSTSQSSGTDVGTLVQYQLGTAGTVAAPTSSPVPPGDGSMYINAGVLFHGASIFDINSFFGEKILSSGAFSADNEATVTINQTLYTPQSPTPWTTTTAVLNSNELNSRSNAFTTVGGSILDGLARSDASGNPRGIGNLVPPSILTIDPQTNETRYLEDTRESGLAEVGSVAGSPQVNAGEFGHGQGIYVSNGTDLQNATSETDRAAAGSQQSLVNDWLNPNNGDSNSGWRGPFYVPVGAYVQFNYNGLTIQRDDATWKNPDGTDSGQYTITYRFGTVNGQLYVVDSLETPTTIFTNAVNYSAGQPFNGVIYCDGNVRVRGQIPTDVQLTLVSGGSIYIEGSITKGVLGNDVTNAFSSSDPRHAAPQATITSPSTSMLMLMAKDFVALNTTQFFGLIPGQNITQLNDQDNDTGYSPVTMPAGGGTADGSLTFTTEFLTDPNSGTPANPSSWQAYATEYTDSINGGAALPIKMLLTHTMADGAGPATFFSMDVNFGSSFPTQYSFPVTGDTNYFSGLSNTAGDYLSTPTITSQLTMYGLGDQPWQRYTRFESRDFDLTEPGFTTYSGTTGVLANTNPNSYPYMAYDLFAPGPNDFLIRPAHLSTVPSNDYLLARAGVAPHDVRIEASIYAEEGSFFVIPGPWFNPNPNDTRGNFNAVLNQLESQNGLSSTQALFQANQQRLVNFGNSPAIPFYGEPLDVKVSIVGSVSENMPPPAAEQAESLKKWGWIPMYNAASATGIPTTHVPTGLTSNVNGVVPNVIVSYDPYLSTGRTTGYTATNNPSDLIRTDGFGRALPPMPRLPVSPALVYFGELQ